MWHRAGSILGAVPLALVATLAAAQVLAPSSADPLMAPPANSFPQGEFTAQGVQIYACRQRDGRPAWVFQASEATLFDQHGQQYGTQSGPRWILGSRPWNATVEAEAPAPVAGAVPWQMLSLANAGIGHSRGPNIARRHDTVGGVAPTTACTAGQVVRMRFSAMYGLYWQTTR